MIKLKSSLLLTALFSGIAALHFCYRDFIPNWDAGHSFHSAMAALQHQSAHELNIRGHISIAFLGLIAATQYFGFGSMHLYHFVMMALHLLGAAAFYGILRELFPEPGARSRHVLASALFALSPILTSQAVNADMDFAVAIFSTLFVYAALKSSFSGMLLTGTLLAFSRESGAIAVILVCIFGAAYWAFQGRAGLGRFGTFAAALFGLSGVYAYYVLEMFELPPSLQNGGAIWNHALGPATKISYWFNWGFLREISISDRRLWYILFDLFVLQFAWIPSLLLLLAAGRRAAGSLIGVSRSSPCFSSWGFRLCLFLAVSMLLVDISTVIGFDLQHTPRYRLIVWPWLVVAWYAALVYVLPGEKPRHMALVTILALFLVSNWRTVDPVSTRLAGTFYYGRHRLLHMTNWTKEREYPDPGQDRLGYNLQALVLDNLLRRVLADLGPSGRRPLFYRHPRAWLEPLWIEPVTFGRSGNPLHFDGPLHESAQGVLDLPRPLPSFFYLSLPFLKAADEQLLAQLRERYVVTEERTYEYQGYELNLYRLQSREPSAVDLPNKFVEVANSFPKPALFP